MNQDEYDDVIRTTESLLKRVTGWVPCCLPCWLLNERRGGNVTRRWVQMNVRYVSVSGHTSDATVPQHADVTLKCPECRYHQHHGLPLADSELNAYGRLLDKSMNFDAVDDYPDDDTRNQRLRDLGYLE